MVVAGSLNPVLSHLPPLLLILAKKRKKEKPTKQKKPTYLNFPKNSHHRTVRKLSRL